VVKSWFVPPIVIQSRSSYSNATPPSSISTGWDVMRNLPERGPSSSRSCSGLAAKQGIGHFDWKFSGGDLRVEPLTGFFNDDSIMPVCSCWTSASFKRL
jgi:hypothetical protein